MTDNEIEVPSKDELSELANEIISTYIKKGMEGYRKLDPDSRPYPTEYRDGLESDCEFLVPKFEEFYTPGPGEFTEKLDAIDDVASKLGTAPDSKVFIDGVVLGMLDNARGYMEEWEGSLADSFRINYLDHLAQSVVHNQGIVTVLMRDNFQAMRDIYAEARKSLKDIGENGVAAMEQADGMGAADLTTLLTVLGATIGIGAASLSAAAPGIGPAISITSAMIAGGIAIGNDQKPKDKEIPLAADYPDEVLDNIKSALEDLRADIDSKELELMVGILKGAEEVLEAVGDTTKASLLVPMMPELVTTALDDPSGLREGLVQVD